mgnify:CR=1 FL=1
MSYFLQVDSTWITLRQTPLNLVHAPAIVKNRQEGPPPWEEASLYHSGHGRYCHSGNIESMPDVQRDGPLAFWEWSIGVSEQYLQLSDDLRGVCFCCTTIRLLIALTA